jgi:hypothetical protein
MSINEESMRFLEENIPLLADAAIKQAYWQALASGSSVLVCENDVLVETFPDGSRKVLKQLEPQTSATVGQRIELP